MRKSNKLYIFYFVILLFTENLLAQVHLDDTKDLISEKIADRAFAIIKSVKSTKYKNYPYTIDESKGIFETDCAGFITRILKQISPKHASTIPFDEDKSYHTVTDYYNYFDFIQHGNNKSDTLLWKIIRKFDDTKRGDVLVWVDNEYTPTISASHVLLIADTPKFTQDSVFDVIVYDASEKLYNRDIRTGPGVGYGTIKIRTDSKSIPVEYELKIGEGFTKANIVIARAI